jgi:hypothetical protein
VSVVLGQRGGRNLVISPEGTATWAMLRTRVHNAMVKTLVHAFCRTLMLESGYFAIVTEVAECESIAPAYITRVLRLALLAPNIVELALDGRAPQGSEAFGGGGERIVGVVTAAACVALRFSSNCSIGTPCHLIRKASGANSLCPGCSCRIGEVMPDSRAQDRRDGNKAAVLQGERDEQDPRNRRARR